MHFDAWPIGGTYVGFPQAIIEIDFDNTAQFTLLQRGDDGRERLCVGGREAIGAGFVAAAQFLSGDRVQLEFQAASTPRANLHFPVAAFAFCLCGRAMRFNRLHNLR